MKRTLHIVHLLLFNSLLMGAYPQVIDFRDVIVWKGLIKEIQENGIVNEYMSFEGAYSDDGTNLPVYSVHFPLEYKESEITATFTSEVFEPCTLEESAYLSGIGYNSNKIEIKSSVTTERKVTKGGLNFIPIRKNSLTGMYEKLVSLNILITINPKEDEEKLSSRTFSNKSVLSEGDWIKIKVAVSGIFKIGYNELLSYGLDPATIDPRNIKLYGNAGGMLPEKNNLPRFDDLQENAIMVAGEEDGIFDPQDFILFYGMSPHTWYNSLGFFTYDVNLYDDYNYYFLTVGSEAGKRLELQSSSASSPSHIVTSFNDYKVIEDENVNLIMSGKKWYGDVFGETLVRDYLFSFPNIRTSEPVIIKTEVANRTYVNESMSLNINNEKFDTITLTSISVNSTKYAQKKKKTVIYNPSGPNINIRLEYLPSTASSTAWLDYIIVNAISDLNFHNGQLMFRNLACIMDGAVSRFVISDSNPEVLVWEITNPVNPKLVESVFETDQVYFTLPTEMIREFIAFDGSNYFTPEFVGTVDNQNLHGEGPFDLVIVSHPMFLEEAGQLAAIHKTESNFSVKVVTPEQIYNEFSSGKQDPTAIRDYLKMLYDKYDGQEPHFLTLFGDGSFDPKDRIVNNSNLIPTFQTEESWYTSSSYVIEDYFGLLDDYEGDDANGTLDIGIGRLPVQTKEEAQIILKKIQDYIAHGEPGYGNWRTKICMIADDEDGNLHLEQADSLSNWSGFIPRAYNIQKIYLDAYLQLKTPSGYRYPDVNTELNKAVNDGALIVNYVGHGGKAGWAHERILQSNDIIHWTNTGKLPVFITATCEFSRFDEPEFKTGGELVLLNPVGGGIGLFTTTRLAYAQSNFTLNQRVYTRAFAMVDGQYPYLGDIIRTSKPPGQNTTRNFVLLGDPALKLAYPEFDVRTQQIINQETGLPTDTIRALDIIVLKGNISDRNGNTQTGFNGFVDVKVYDKKTLYKTRGNDPYSYVTEFYCQDKIIWSGTATVANGIFEVSFMVPKDIAFNYGQGKISYYAWSDFADAMGYKDDMIIGGINQNASVDVTGPVIDLYLNDLSFVSGMQTHENPVLLAFLSDESGINLSSAGIGHEITLILNEDNLNTVKLNDYYVQDIDSYKSGSITYPFYNLPDGNHTLKLKAWDNYNNSSEKSISFLINTHGPLELSRVMNFPNPFMHETTFTFDHTRPGDILKVLLEIFDLRGNLILTYETADISELTSNNFLVWDGKDASGNKLKSGIYIYTVKVTDEDGNVSTQKQKMLLINQ